MSQDPAPIGGMLGLFGGVAAIAGVAGWLVAGWGAGLVGAWVVAPWIVVVIVSVAQKRRSP